jgi:hypothetical protein
MLRPPGPGMLGHMLIALIVAAEIAFWVFLGAGLAARYLLRWRRVSTTLLVSVPLVDVVLLIVTVVDLRRGAEPEWAHGLAAVYLGFSVAFGHSLIRWADERFAYHFAGGPKPWKPPKGGPARMRYEWESFGKGVLGYLVTAALLGGGYLLVGDHERGAPLLGWIGRLAPPMVIWFVFWPLWETLFPSRPRRNKSVGVNRHNAVGKPADDGPDTAGRQRRPS